MPDAIDKAPYLQALETVKKVKPEANFMTVEISNLTLLLQHTEGLQLIAALEKAEVFHRGWGSPAKLSPINTSNIEIKLIGAARVRLARMSQLMNIPLDDLENQLDTHKIPL